MADNTTLAVNTGGDVIRDLDRTGTGPKTQVIALDVMGTGATEDIGLVAPKSLPIASAGLTTATTAYSIGDVLGTEFTFTNLCRSATRGAILTSAVLIDKAKIIGAVDLYLFDRASTPAADNAANSWADADMANCLGVVNFPAPTVSALNGVAVANAGIPLVVDGNASPDVKGVLVTRAAHTFFGAVGDLVLCLGIEPA
jgi:hypothetical protein